ncbi:LOW QUALITY PROTEIN: uncharacterized protein tp53i13 [Boleophthalmus pectinirostris]|uniref:LOW QUALITY PROTEIN: uncharacterized protein tp53i13 n=1 Tax=Boleophthalmus pectinirostris TaxID=150288 RepID=UPI002431BAA3|nr:LOW QUALITY PROTEIN: uncharacterized protein tp53i13 [Boleophthalmus pectinirostris]
MPTQTITTLPGSVALLAALLVILGRCLGGSAWPGCDNGKVLLDTDLPKDASHWDCPTPLWPQSQRLNGVDTVYDPEPAKLTCMDQRISYNLIIPNSGTFRPVSAESGEYLYCPPQRWLNNLHHGATVLLYHPCSPLHERLLLSALAQSCISEYILTPHKNLDKKRPFAFVSWGRTLEVSTVASSEICDWLNQTSFTKPKATEQRHKNHYSHLLTRSVDQNRHQENKESPTEIQRSLFGQEGSLKQCCEQTISSLLEKMKTQVHSNFKTGITELKKERVKRAAVKSTTDFPKVTSNQTSSIIHRLQSNAIPKTISSQHGDQSHTKDALSQSTSLKENLLHKKFMPNTSRTATNNVSLIHPQGQLHTVDSNDNNIEKVQSKSNTTARMDISKQKAKGVTKVVANPKVNEVIDLEEREIDKMNNVKSHQSGSNAVDSASKSQAVGYLPNSGDCQCKPNQVCECDTGAGDRSQSAGGSFQRTPRTDEAVWAAGALGFLLVLLTLSILHTRLYKHWRRGTSLYWHDPQQDYDSVADVIRRRLRISKRRRKRGRKKECVLLPSSSSSEEYP